MVREKHVLVNYFTSQVVLDDKFQCSLWNLVSPYDAHVCAISLTMEGAS